MKSKTRGYRDKFTAIQTLTTAGKKNAKIVEAFVNEELAAVLNDRKLKKIKMERAIFSHLKNGLVISGPIYAPKKNTRSNQSELPRPVGFLLNTMRLVDPVSRRALKPGVTLIEKRPLMTGGFAFDYVGGDCKVKMTTDTHQSHHGGNRPGLSDSGGSDPAAKQHFDIEVNHIILARAGEGPWKCDLICISYSDGTEKCVAACDDDADLGFTVID
ncbi:MAG: hypothetical protein ACR2OJ_01535 [Hyphomicrobiales bacterium]